MKKMEYRSQEKIRVFLDVFLQDEPEVALKSKANQLLNRIFPKYSLQFQGKTPRVTAVAIIYLAHVLMQYKTTQERLRIKTNVSVPAMRVRIHHIIHCLDLQDEIDRAWSSTR